MKDAMTADALADALVQRGVIRERGGPIPSSTADRPWYISAVLGAAGWLAGLFTLGFVAILFGVGFDPAAAFGIAGAIMLAAAFGLYRVGQDSPFVGQLALALSIAGQLGIAFAVGDATESAAVTSAFMVVLQLALLFALPNRMARTLAAVFACVAWVLAIRFALWGDDIFDQSPESIAPLPALLTWLGIWAPLIFLTYALIAFEARWMGTGLRTIARPALTGLLVALSVATWASEPFASLQVWLGEARSANWLVLWPLLGAATALYAAVCAFRLRDRALIGVAITGALLHVSQFYYLLGTTLLVKSLLMLGVGVALFAVAWILRQRGGKGSLA